MSDHPELEAFVDKVSTLVDLIDAVDPDHGDCVGDAFEVVQAIAVEARLLALAMSDRHDDGCWCDLVPTA